MKVHIGIDVSKETLDVCWVSEGLAKPIFLKVRNTQAGFMQLLEKSMGLVKSGEFHFAMESTGSYEFDLASFLCSAGQKVCVLNPARVKEFIRSQGWKNKTDKADAKAIAEYQRMFNPPVWYLSDPARREMTQLVRCRTRLLQELSRVRNWMEHYHQHSEFHQAQNRTIAMVLESQIGSTDTEIIRLVESNESFLAQFSALTRILGVGAGLAIVLMCEMGPVENYASAQQYAAHAGLAPCIKESGSMSFKSRISKAGNSHVRSMAWMPALVASTSNPLVIPLAKRLKAKGLANKQVRVACMRKLLMLAYGVLKALAEGRTPFYGQPEGKEAPKQSKLKIRSSSARLFARKLQTLQEGQDPLEHRLIGWRCKAKHKKENNNLKT